MYNFDPFLNRVYRWFYFWRNELMFTVIFARLVGWDGGHGGYVLCSRQSWLARKISDLGHHVIKGHIKRVVKDQALAEKLTPNYDLGCKRITPSDTYLQVPTYLQVTWTRYMPLTLLPNLYTFRQNPTDRPRPLVYFKLDKAKDKM